MSNNKDFYKQCKGCRSYSQMVEKPSCSIRRIPYIPEGLVCPCSICLVKGMCNKPCEEFIKFVERLKEIETELCKTLFKGENNDY